MKTSSIAQSPPEPSGSNTSRVLSVWPGSHSGSTVLSAILGLGRQLVYASPESEPTVMLRLTPLASVQRTMTFRVPHVPLVRRAKKRNVGCSAPTQNHADATSPSGRIDSDLLSADERTLKLSLPVTTEARASAQPVVPSSKLPPDARL